MATPFLVPFLVALSFPAPAPAPQAAASMLTAPQAGERPWMGVSLAETEEGQAGLAVISVLKDSPAEKAGLKAGDRILAFGKRERGISNYEDLMGALSGMKPGQGVGLWVARAFELKLDAEHVSANGRPLMGIGVEDRDRGVFVSSVNEGYPAARAGLKKGDRVISVDGVVLGSGDALIELLGERKPGQALRAEVARGFEMKLGSAPAAQARGMLEAEAKQADADRQDSAKAEKADRKARADDEAAERKAQAAAEKSDRKARADAEKAETKARAEAEKARSKARADAERARADADRARERAEQSALQEREQARGGTPSRGRFVPIPVPEEGPARAERTERPERPERAERPAPPAAEAAQDLRMELRRLAEELAAMRRELTQLRREFDSLQRGRDR